MQKSVPAFRASAPSVVRYTFGFVLLSAVLAIIVALVIVQDRLRGQYRDALAVAVSTRAEGAVLAYARSLHDDWRAVRALAVQAATAEPEALRVALDAAVGGGARVSWAGYAALDGTVIAASGGLLEGRNVGERPWFRFGLEDGFAGDVHEALLLAELLPPTEDGDPRRFLDLAAPVVSASGSTIGVVGFHVDYGWAQRYLADMAEALKVDLFLLDADGAVMIASDGHDYPVLNMASVRAAATGATAINVETWPNGIDYFTTVLPGVGFADLPSFGWRMVARIDGGAIDATSREMTFNLGLLLATFAVALVLATMLFTRIFLKPFGEVADSALAIADGRDDYPPEIRRTAELEKLSAALSRIQSRLSA